MVRTPYCNTYAITHNTLTFWTSIHASLSYFAHDLNQMVLQVLLLIDLDLGKVPHVGTVLIGVTSFRFAVFWTQSVSHYAFTERTLIYTCGTQRYTILKIDHCNNIQRIFHYNKYLQFESSLWQLHYFFNVHRNISYILHFSEDLYI